MKTQISKLKVALPLSLLLASACGSPHPQSSTGNTESAAPPSPEGITSGTESNPTPWIGFDSGSADIPTWISEASRQAIQRMRDPEFYGSLTVRSYRWLLGELEEQTTEEARKAGEFFHGNPLRDARTESQSDEEWVKELESIRVNFEKNRNEYELGHDLLKGTRDLTLGALSAGAVAAASTGAGLPVTLATSAAIEINRRAFGKILSLYEQDAEESARQFLSLKLRELPEHAWMQWDAAAAQGPNEARKFASEQISTWVRASGGSGTDAEAQTVRSAVESLILKAAVGELAKEKSLARLRDTQVNSSIETLQERLGAVGGALLSFTAESNRQFSEIADSQQQIAGELQKMREGLEDATQVARESQGKVLDITHDVGFLARFMFSGMSISEQKAALQNGFMEKLSTAERGKLVKKMELLEQRQKLEEKVAAALNGAQTLLSVGEQLGINPKAIAQGREIVSKASAITNLVGSIASGNWIETLNGIGQLFGAQQGPSVADLRHDEIMKGLGALQQGQEELVKGQQALMEGQKVLLEYAQASVEMSQAILDNQKRSFEAMVQLSDQMATYHQEVLSRLDILEREFVINRELVRAIGRSNISKCNSFLSTRARFDSFSKQTREFDSASERREHLNEYRPEFLSCVTGLDDLLKSGGNFNSYLAAASYSDAAKGINHLVNDIYIPSLEMVRGLESANPGLLRSLALPATHLLFMDEHLAALNGEADRNALVLPYSGSDLKSLISSEVLTSVVEELFEVLPYLDVVDFSEHGEFPSLMSLLAGNGRRSDPKRPRDLLESALEKINLAIAQESLIAGQGLLPQLHATMNTGAVIDSRPEAKLLAANPLLAMNYLVYAAGHLLKANHRSLYSYEAARNFKLDDRYLREVLGTAWKYSQKDGKWGVTLGGKWTALPDGAALAEDRIEYRSSMNRLIELRARISSQLAELDLLRQDARNRTGAMRGLLLGAQ